MDIDIDFANRDAVLEKIQHINAALVDGRRHNTGVYVTYIPHNPLTNTSTIDYKIAEQRGYFKIDFLNVSIYQHVRDEQHLTHLINQEPMWELLQHPEFVEHLFHLSGHVELLRKTKPGSIEQLAAVMAMIRPAKRHLVGSDWDKVFSEVWTPPSTGEYYWKKAHAIAYAMAVVVQMNLLCEQLSESGHIT